MDSIDTIEVSARRQVEVAAHAVNLHISINGSSFFTGTAALSKAKEVKQLVAAICAAGLSEEDIKLQGVRAESSSGVFGRSSTAIYELRVHCPKLELLADVLGAVTSQSNAVLQRVTWLYPDTDLFRAELVTDCLKEAKLNATMAAETLQVDLLGVHRVTQTWSEPTEARMQMFDAAPAAVAAKRAFKPVELGFKLSHEKIVALDVKAAFRVSGFRTKPA